MNGTEKIMLKIFILLSEDNAVVCGSDYFLF